MRQTEDGGDSNLLLNLVHKLLKGFYSFQDLRPLWVFHIEIHLNIIRHGCQFWLGQIDPHFRE